VSATALRTKKFRLMQDMVFVAGAPRSGTTLFRLLLDNHPRIFHPGEFDFLFDWVGDDGEWPDLRRYAEWLSTNRIFLDYAAKIDPKLEFPELARSLVRQTSAPGRMLALSVQRGYHKIPYLFPEARFIHLVRDPRDAALSTIQMGWAGTVHFGVDPWMGSERSWDTLVSRVDPTRMLEIKYEELVSHPRETLRAVCGFLQIEFDECMMEYHRHSSYEPIHARSVGKWRSQIPRRELAMLEHKISNLLLDRGYELSGAGIRTPSRFALTLLKMRNAAYIWRFKARKYGLGIFCAEKIARVLGIKWLGKRLRLAMNEIDHLHLQ
jgi:hypothetical protein